MLTKTQIIDGRDHLLGRLASIVSKELLAGQNVVIVRCDEIVVSGSCECGVPVFTCCTCSFDVWSTIHAFQLSGHATYIRGG